MTANNCREFLLQQRNSEGFFTSGLSDSAVSTATACLALELADAQKYSQAIRNAREWLLSHRDQDALYGDSPESPANLTATFLAYTALVRDPESARQTNQTREWLLQQFQDFSFPAVKKAFLEKYGRDLTFSVPILALATAAGFFPDAKAAWRDMPYFPFEAVCVPEALFRHLRLPVVSYALPALICVGLAQQAHARRGLLRLLRSICKGKALRVLSAKQPESGGFLEAAPLTAFCAICLCSAGLREHPVTQKSLTFLLETQRDNGAWPIDSDLNQWVTSLALASFGQTLSAEEKFSYRNLLKEQQCKAVHPFTRAAPGGWCWTNRTGGVPDADDTAAALIALHTLGERSSDSVRQGLCWLLDLQNRDGGLPTFCRGWGKFPFDRSSADLSAHAYKALSLYEPMLPAQLQQRIAAAKRKILSFLEQNQQPDGSFLPLWFGDQTAPDGLAPVYGTALVLEHLADSGAPFLAAAVRYLLQHQHTSGGWGNPAEDGQDYVFFTTRCIRALQPYHEANAAIIRAQAYLQPFREHPESIPLEPVGLYFSQLWYSEKLYPAIFLASEEEQE